MRISEVKGKAIMSADGVRLGRAEDILLDSDHRRVIGLLTTDGVLSKQHILLFGDIQTVGVDAIVVKTAATMHDAKDWLREGRAAIRAQTVGGKTVVTVDGAQLGTVRDLIADDETGRVTALEIAPSRHSRIKAPLTVHALDEIQLGNDVVVVPNSAADIDAPDGGSVVV